MGFKSRLRKLIDELSRRLFQVLPGFLTDGRLKRTLSVRRHGGEVFRMRDFGGLARMRVSTFETKEPETLGWIDGFASGERLLDVGANVGLYSLYAASRGCEVCAIEPDAGNFALLQENIRLNSFFRPGLIRSYALALHSSFMISELNISGSQWGAALNSFANTTDFKGDEFEPLFKQGCVGVSLDVLLDETGFCPDYIKIDVDGNEIEVLRGASGYLKSKTLKSLLIELDERRKDYGEALAIIQSSGLRLTEKIPGALVANTQFDRTFNHIFSR